VRYYDEQFLKDQNFINEQKYHINRQRLSNRLHVSGIIEGLEVDENKEDGKLTIMPGTAIDQKGRMIVLTRQKPIEIPSEGILAIVYQEEVDPLRNDGEERWQEKPIVTMVKKEEKETQEMVVLGSITMGEDKKLKYSNKERQYSGVFLPTEDGKGVTLRSQCQENQNLAVLTGNLSISVTLGVSGESTLTGNVNANGSLTVTNNGTGNIASFSQEGLGGGVHISGVKGNNCALEISDNKTHKNTLYVENEGNGATLFVQQKGTGKAAVFEGKVTVDGDTELTGSLGISKGIAVTGESKLTGNVNANGSLIVT